MAVAHRDSTRIRRPPPASSLEMRDDRDASGRISACPSSGASDDGDGRDVPCAGWAAARGASPAGEWR